MNRLPLRLLAFLVVLLACAEARAEPYLAVQQGYACSACHFNPTGGGLRSEFGTVFAENVMPSVSAPALGRYWNGRIGSRLAIGADARASDSRVCTIASYTSGSMPRSQRAANFTARRMRTGSSRNAGVTCRST